MKAYIISLAVLLALSLTAFPAFAEETEDTASKEGEKTVIIKITGEGECTEISSSDGEEGIKKIIIKCPEGECPDLSELGFDIDVIEMTGEEGTIKKKIIIDYPEGKCPDIGKFEMEFDIDMDEAGLSAEKMTISMIVDDDGEKVTIKARGDKDKLKPEIDQMLEDLGEDGGKVTTKELEDGYDITIEK